jgi:putative heme-binding domain-containing protein
MMRRPLLASAVLGLIVGLPVLSAAAAEPARPRKVVLIAGPLDKSHPPGTHEYEKSVRLLKHCLDTSPNVKGVRSEAHLGGWPADPRTLDDADTIVLIASGSDRREQDHPLLVGDRLRVIERQMKRGCGLVLIHWATFLPRDKAGALALDWVGGYFDYESGPPPQHWYSKIQVATTTARPATPDHPVCRGLAPFQLREEYYYHIRFRDHDPRLVPILKTPIPGEKDEQAVAWAVERQDGGRGFAFTGGHFFDNWRLENFRRMVLNAVVWTAGAEVPERGVRSRPPTDAELAHVAVQGPAPANPPPPRKAGPSSDKQLDYRPAAPRLRAVLLDRSEGESYVSIKSDSEGRLFVGGREALFVFEPDGKGGYRPRRELYRFPPDSWVAGIEVRGNDLYVLTAAALYLFPDGRIRHDGLKPRRLLWGLPLDLHVSFHCLAWGPEGDLYLTHGDPLLNYGDFSRPDHWGHWTLFAGPEGKRVPYTGQGAVLRLRPDGTGLRVVARGLRGPFGLAFDHAWNLFTNDNDHESLPDRYTPARLLYVSPHVDFAWPRGWMASKSPDRADLVEPLLSAPGRGVPVGLAYYDESLLPAEYRHTLLEDRWDRLTVQCHPLRRRGAGFAAEDVPFLVGKYEARPIGVAVGPGGQVFATVSYMAANEASPHYTSDLVLITPTNQPAAAPAVSYDVTSAPAEKLWAELSNPSWQRRLQAHTEILRCGGPLLAEAVRRLAAAKPDDPAMMHLPWLAAASGSAQAVRVLADLAKHPRPEVRLQAVRALAEFFPRRAPARLLEAALADSDPQVQLAALAAFFDPTVALPLGAVTDLARSPDPYLRQTATRLLARRATLDQLQDLLRSPDPAVRLAGVLAAGVRLTTPPDEPPPQVRLVYPAENAFFKVKIHYADGEADLRALGRVGSYTTAEYWKAITPDAEQTALFRLLMAALQDPTDAVRLQAAYYLSLLRDPRSEPAVARTFAAVQEGRLASAPRNAVENVWAVGPFPDADSGFRPAHPPEQGVIDLTARYDTPVGPAAWEKLEGKGGAFSLRRTAKAAGPSSLYAFCQLQSAARQPALFLVSSEAGVKVWHNGRPVWESAPDSPRPHEDGVLLDLQPGGNDLLIRSRQARGGHSLQLHYRAHGEVRAGLPEKLDFATLAQRLKEAGSTGKQVTVAPEFLAVDWQQEVRRGNAAEGRKLFGALGCVKCHAITAGQKGGGAPSLTDAGKRFTVPYLVESVLLPSKQVAEPFRSTSIVTTGGQVVSGLVVNETADSLELLLPDTSRRVLAKKDVEERTVTAVSPMPAGLVKTPRELRDLLAYLLGDNPLPP